MKRKSTTEIEEEETSEVEEEEEEEEDGVLPAAVIGGSKHSDGSIYRVDEHILHKLFRLDDTRETRLKPMRLTLPTKNCHPCVTNCWRHMCGTMLQIFSLKLNRLAKVTEGGPIQLYGFMAVRDLLDPLRNYVFNYSRHHPYIVEDINSDPFINLSGPKRGIYLQSPVLIEYDIWIKKGEREQDDLSLIDGALTCSELTFIQGPFTYRIKGDHGASVDISRALFRGAVEATVDVQIIELVSQRNDDGSCSARSLDLTVSGFVPPIKQDIKLFRGVVDKPGWLGRFVVAVISNSFLFVFFKVPGESRDCIGRFAFRAVAHGTICSEQKFSFATIEVKVTWSGLC